MALWNYTSHSPIEAFQGVNTLTTGLFGAGIIVLIWLMVFFRQGVENNRDKIVAANIVAGFGGILLSFVNIVNEFTLGVLIVILIASIGSLAIRPGQG